MLAAARGRRWTGSRTSPQERRADLAARSSSPSRRARAWQATPKSVSSPATQTASLVLANTCTLSFQEKTSTKYKTTTVSDQQICD